MSVLSHASRLKNMLKTEGLRSRRAMGILYLLATVLLDAGAGRPLHACVAFILDIPPTEADVVGGQFASAV